MQGCVFGSPGTASEPPRRWLTRRFVRCSLCPAVSDVPLVLWQCPGTVSVRCVWGCCVRLFAGGTLRSGLPEV
eukprot:2293052-Alexandrium_andersonii.AAC.1